MKYTNKYHLPEILVRALKRNDHKQEGKYSVSQLVNPPRVEWLKRRHDEEIVRDASENLWSLLGTAIHSVIEKNGGSSDLIEQHLCVEVNEVKISGTPDHFNIDTLTLNDWKCTSIWTYIYGGRSEWVQALNIYAWMLSKKFGKYAKKLVNQMILRDHSKRDAKFKPDYPKVPFAQMEQEVWPPEQTEQFIMSRLALHEDSEDTPDAELPACTDEERWKKEDIWKVYKNETSVRAMPGGVHEGPDAEAKARSMAKKNSGDVRKIKGETMRCAEYCDAAPWCNQYQKEIEHE